MSAVPISLPGVKPPVQEWATREPVKTVTFIVTQDCQLRCRYCYLVGKNNRKKMEFGVAKRTVDYLIDHVERFPEGGVIWEFIGGEPFLEIDLIDQVSDYAKIAMYQRHTRWFNNYRFSFSTNGLLYADKRVQRYLAKNHTHLSIALTLDGTRRKHDLQRVYPDGRGSYDDIVKNIPLWLSQFPQAATKVTVGHEDLPYIVESVLHLFSLGIANVNINTIFENVWEPGDDEVFESQLMQLADVIVQRGLYADYYCSFFTEFLGHALDPVLDKQNWCGAGKMLAIDADGIFYPCLRFAPFAMSTHKSVRSVGNCFDGMDDNRLRPFLTLNRTMQSPKECIECEVASGCAWCQGYNLDAADTDTVFQRATAICRMHKARVRANDYYWKILKEKIAGTESQGRALDDPNHRSNKSLRPRKRQKKDQRKP